MSFNVFATVTITGNDYRIHFWLTSKDVAVNRMKNSDLVKKVDECKKKKRRKKKNKERCKQYYQDDKERLQEMTCD